MKIPNVSIIEGPPGSIETLGLGEVILKCRSDVVRVAKLRHILISRSCTPGPCSPEVKVFRHVNLLKHIHKALLLGRTLDLVI